MDNVVDRRKFKVGYLAVLFSILNLDGEFCMRDVGIVHKRHRKNHICSTEYPGIGVRADREFEFLTDFEERKVLEIDFAARRVFQLKISFTTGVLTISIQKTHFVVWGSVLENHF